MASCSAHVFLSYTYSNVRASMPLQKWFRFRWKEESCRDVTQADVVGIHHHVLKSTTSAGAVRDVRDMRERRDSKFWSEIPKPRTSDL